MQHMIQERSGDILLFFFPSSFHPILFLTMCPKARGEAVSYALPYVGQQEVKPSLLQRHTADLCWVCSGLPQLLFCRAAPQATHPQTVSLQGLLYPGCTTLRLLFLNFLMFLPAYSYVLRSLWTAALLSNVWTLPRFAVIPQNDKVVFCANDHGADEGMKQYQFPKNTTCTWLPLRLSTLWAQWSSHFFTHLVVYLSRSHLSNLAIRILREIMLKALLRPWQNNSPLVSPCSQS